MKIRITGLPKGFGIEGLSPEGLNEMISTTKPPKKDIIVKNKEMDTNKKVSRLGNEKWEKEYYAPFREWLKKNKGVDATFKTHEEYQQAVAKYAPDLLLNKLKSGEMPLTNRHREILGLSDDVTSFDEIPPAKLKEMGENVDNILVDGYIDASPGHRGIDFKNTTAVTPAKEATVVPAPNVQETSTDPLNYDIPVDNFQKDPYNRRKLPFYQIAPDLANFAAANDMYNYWTPDYTHQEIQPPTLNIQDQLNSMDSSMNAVLATTTGDPNIDQARKQAVMNQILQAKDSAYARKQNYDAEGRFKADEYNINERNKEMVNDINAASTIHNEYVAEAKDNMTYEKMASIQNMYRKYMMNEATENKYEMMSQMFNNVGYDAKTGKMKISSNPNDINAIREQRMKEAQSKPRVQSKVKTEPTSTFGGRRNLPFLDPNVYDNIDTGLDFENRLDLNYESNANIA
jgi:hypothetical protein